MPGTQSLISVPGSPLYATTAAPVLTPAFASGVAAQLSDTTRDYNVYLNVTTSGTSTSVTMGPTSATVTAVSILASASVTAGQVITFRVPAGWWVAWTGTTTVLAQAAVGC